MFSNGFLNTPSASLSCPVSDDWMVFLHALNPLFFLCAFIRLPHCDYHENHFQWCPMSIKFSWNPKADICLCIYLYVIMFKYPHIPTSNLELHVSTEWLRETLGMLQTRPTRCWFPQNEQALCIITEHTPASLSALLPLILHPIDAWLGSQATSHSCTTTIKSLGFSEAASVLF